MQTYTSVRGTYAARDSLWLDRGGRYFVSVRATNYAGMMGLYGSSVKLAHRPWKLREPVKSVSLLVRKERYARLL